MATPKLPEWCVSPQSIPEGYRQLEQGEKMKPGDKVWHLWGEHKNDWCTLDVSPEIPVGVYEIAIRIVEEAE